VEEAYRLRVEAMDKFQEGVVEAGGSGGGAGAGGVWPEVGR